MRPITVITLYHAIVQSKCEACACIAADLQDPPRLATLTGFTVVTLSLIIAPGKTIDSTFQ